jgi:hypothetical protein
MCMEYMGVAVMFAKAFRSWLSKAKELTPTQRQQTVEGLRDERPAPSPLVEVLDPTTRPARTVVTPRVGAGAAPAACRAFAAPPAARPSIP